MFARCCRRLGLLLIAAVLAPWRPAACADALRLLTNDNPPFSIVDAEHRVTGISADMVVEMARRADLTVAMETYPWKRAFDAALNDPDACIFSAARLPEREALFQWIGPIANNSWTLFARADFQQPIANLAAARGLVVGGQVQEAKSLYLTAEGLTVDVLPNDDLNPQRLKEGRIDLWVTGLYTGPMKAAAAGVTGLKPVLVFRRVDVYLACNRTVPQATIGGLRAALDDMRRDGKVAEITQHYAGAAPQD